MFRNLMSFLFVIAISLPAIAMPMDGQMSGDCHALTSDVAGHDQGDADSEHDPADPAAMHGCIGCIAPYHHAPVEPEMTGLPTIELAAWTPRELTPRADSPETPPPRA